MPSTAAPTLFREHQMVSSLGLTGYLRYRFQRAKSKLVRLDLPWKLTSRLLAHPVLCRPRTSDARVFKQIFVHCEYDCLDDCGSPQLILDCGGNVGYSSAYFLSRFPTCKVISIEPDPHNFAVLKTNLSPYGDRCKAVLAAVWPEKASLQLSMHGMGIGQEWGRQVEIAEEANEHAIPGVDIASILHESGFDRISILKIDIEGAERFVFEETAKKWIDRVDNIVIELHDQECRDRFCEIVSQEAFSFEHCGGLTICKRKT